MENKFNISDIIRYMLIGLFFVFCLAYMYCVYTDTSFTGLLKETFSSSQESINGLSIMIILLLAFYLLGITIQGISKMLTTSLFFAMHQPSKKHSFISNGLYQIFNLLFFKITPDSRCLELKRKARLDVPEWIKISKDPPRLMEHIKLSIEMKQPSLNMNEYFHFNELFQGVYISSIILLIISSVGLYTIDIASDTYPPYVYFGRLALVFIPAAILSYVLSRIYASRGIMTLDTRKKTLEIDISKNLRKTGLQQVHVLIRTHRITPKNGRTEEDALKDQLNLLKEAIGSVADQDYYSINILLLGDCYCYNIDTMIKDILKKHGEKLSIQYCFEKGSNIAQSSRSIRNQILDIANNDDIIMFLNDDDFFYRKNAISDIVYRMNSLNANLCLSAFNVNSQKDDNIVIKNGRLHNTLVRKLSRHSKAVTQKDKSLWHFASTISWTKIYRADLLNKLNDITKEINESCLEGLVAFEDFMDYLVFMLNDIRVTAVGEPVYSYRKHDKGNIHKRDKIAFEKLRLGYLHLVKEVVELSSNYQSDNQPETKQRIDDLFKNGAISQKQIRNIMVDAPNVRHAYNYLGLKIYEINEIIDKFVALGILNLSEQNHKEWFTQCCIDRLGNEKHLYWKKNRENNNDADDTLYFEEMVAELENFEFD